MYQFSSTFPPSVPLLVTLMGGGATIKGSYGGARLPFRPPQISGLRTILQAGRPKTEVQHVHARYFGPGRIRREMNSAFHAGLLGLLGGSALIMGAAAGYWLRLPQRLIAAVMALGAGVLVSVIAFELMDRAYTEGGSTASAAGFLTGAGLFTICNHLIERAGGEHRKRSGCDPCAVQNPEAGLAIAAGTLLDGLPESFVIGVSSIDGAHASIVTVAAFFISNIPEGLSSAAGMKAAGRGAPYVFGVWGAITVASALSAVAGHFLLASAPPAAIAGALSLAAGAILAMLVDTMIPEAAHAAPRYNGFVAAVGFLSAFAFAKLLG